MKLGDKIKIGNENYTLQKEYKDFFLAVDEYITNIKRIPKLVRIK